MTCAWKELLSVLPEWTRTEISRISDAEKSLQEIRLRINQPPELVLHETSMELQRKISSDDLNFCINFASRYSPWNASTMSQGYVTGPGGHRIGICGTAVYRSSVLTGLRDITSVCIRVARDIPGIAQPLALKKTSVLIVGAPGWGKTTLLRDLIRQRSNLGEHVCVADERSELFPQGHFLPGKCTDILTGCTKAEGIDMLLRTMSPGCIAVDEITAESDCDAIIRSAWCGVSLIATAHAASISDFKRRPIYAPLVKSNIFDTIVVLHSDKSWHLERSRGCYTNGSAQF